MSQPRTDLWRVVRLSELLANVSGSEQIAGMVVDEFLSHVDSQLGAIATALRAEDASLLLQTAHRYKGSLAAIYAGAALDVARTLESAAKRRDFEAARTEHISLTERTGELVSCLKDWRVSHPTATKPGKLHG